MTADALNNLRIASPCNASWDDMEGDDRKRFCGDCALHVYNLAGLTSDEAMGLIERSEGRRLCLRMFKRADGTVVTRDCPKGLAGVRRRAARVAVLAAGLLGVGSATAAAHIAAPAASCPTPGAEVSWVERIPALRYLRAALTGDSGSSTGHWVLMGEPLMGDVEYVPPAPSTSP